MLHLGISHCFFFTQDQLLTGSRKDTPGRKRLSVTDSAMIPTFRGLLHTGSFYFTSNQKNIQHSSDSDHVWMSCQNYTATHPFLCSSYLIVVLKNTLCLCGTNTVISMKLLFC